MVFVNIVILEEIFSFSDNISKTRAQLKLLPTNAFHLDKTKISFGKLFYNKLVDSSEMKVYENILILATLLSL